MIIHCDGNSNSLHLLSQKRTLKRTDFSDIARQVEGGKTCTQKFLTNRITETEKSHNSTHCASSGVLPCEWEPSINILFAYECLLISICFDLAYSFTVVVARICSFPLDRSESLQSCVCCRYLWSVVCSLVHGPARCEWCSGYLLAVLSEAACAWLSLSLIASLLLGSIDTLSTWTTGHRNASVTWHTSSRSLLRLGILRSVCKLIQTASRWTGSSSSSSHDLSSCIGSGFFSLLSVVVQVLGIAPSNAHVDVVWGFALFLLHLGLEFVLVASLFQNPIELPVSLVPTSGEELFEK